MLNNRFHDNNKHNGTGDARKNCSSGSGNSSNNDNANTDGVMKSVKSVAVVFSGGKLSRSLWQWRYLAMILVFISLVWAVTSTGRAYAQQDKKPATNNKAPEKKSAKPSDKTSGQEAGKTNKQASGKSANSSSGKTASSKTAKSAQKTGKKNIKNNSSEDEAFKLLKQLLEESQKNPKSKHVKELNTKLDAAMNKLQDKMKNSPDAQLNKLPAAPASQKATSGGGKAASGGSKAGYNKKRHKTYTTPNIKPLPGASNHTQSAKPVKHMTLRDVLRRNKARAARRVAVKKPVAKPKTTVVKPKTATAGITKGKSVSSTSSKANSKSVNIKTPVQSVGNKPTAKTATAAAGGKTAGSSSSAGSGSKAASGTAKQSGQEGETSSDTEAVQPREKPKPDDIVQLKTTDNVIDINMLIELVGKEYGFNFIYAPGVEVAGKVKLRQYGQIHYRDLMPLLESVLRFTGYSLIRDDPFIRVVKRTDVNKKAAPLMSFGEKVPNPGPGDSMVSQIVELKNITSVEAQSFLGQFSDTASMIVIPNTNKLIITDYVHRLPRLIKMLGMIDIAGPARHLEVLKPQYLTAEEVVTPVKSLMSALATKALVSTGTTLHFPPPPRNESSSARRARLYREAEARKRAAAAAANSKSKGIGKAELYIQTDKRTDRIMLVGTDEQIKQFKELMALFDVPQPGQKIKLKVIPIEYISAQDASTAVKSLIQALHSGEKATQSPSKPAIPAHETSSQRRERLIREAMMRSRGISIRSNSSSGSTSAYTGPYMQVDTRTNRILVVGTDEQISQLNDLLDLIDVPLGGPEIRVVPLEAQYVQADKLTTQISSLLKALEEQKGQPAAKGVASPTISKSSRSVSSRSRSSSSRSSSSVPSGGGGLVSPKGPYLMPDIRTRNIFVVGSDEQISRVRDLKAMLDIPAGGPEIKVTTLDIVNVDVQDVTSQIKDLLQAISEQQGQGGTVNKKAGSNTNNRRSFRTTNGTVIMMPGGIAQSSSRNRTASSSQGMAGPKGPYLMADERTSRMFVVGDDTQLAQVKDLLSLLDVPAPGAEIKLVVVPLHYLDGKNATDQLSQIIEAMNAPKEAGSNRSLSQRTSTSMRSRQMLQQRSSTRSANNRDNSGFTRASQEGPFLMADGRMHRLLIIGNQQQVDQVKEILGILDVDRGIKLVPVQIKNVFAEDIAQQLAQLIKALTDQDNSGSGVTTGGRKTGTSSRGISAFGGGSRALRSSGTTRGGRGSVSTSLIETGAKGPLLLPDERTNRLLIVGTSKDIKQVMDLLPLLDVPPSDYQKMQLKVYQPQYVEAAEVLKILDQLGITKSDQHVSPRDRARGVGNQPTRGFSLSNNQGGSAGGNTGTNAQGLAMLEEPEIKVAVQESTNRIFVYADANQQQDIAKVMQHIDLEPNEAQGAIQVYFLQNRKPDVISDMLKNLLESEQVDAQKKVTVPGKENAPIIVPLNDIYGIAVRGSSKQHQEIAKIVKTLDKRLPQVLVEAILVQVNESDALTLGTSLKESYSVGGTNGDTRRISGLSPFSFNANLAQGGKVVTGSGGTLAFFNKDFVYATVEALQTNGNGRVFSMPRVLVNDNEKATIKSERQEPTTTVTVPPGSDTTVESFKGYEKAGTTLDITPHISEGNFLQLEITLSVDSFDGKSTGSIPPPKTNNEVTTTVTVPDNMYIVLGGLTTKTDSTKVSKVPLLGDIPIVGTLFRKVERTNVKGVLYLFVRAQIIRSMNDKGQTDFSDIKHITDKQRLHLDKMNNNYKQQPIIPGIKEKKTKGDFQIFDE